MQDLISRQAAIDAIESEKIKHGDYLTSSYVGYEMAEKVVKQLPPIQPEIIRCKDCKYAEYIDDVQTLWCTECGQGRTVAQYDFCSYGKRREDG